MRGTVATPSNGKANKTKSRGQAKNRPPALSLRRLTKRQKEKIYRIFTIVFLLAFAISIVGGLLYVSVQAR